MIVRKYPSMKWKYMNTVFSFFILFLIGTSSYAMNFIEAGQLAERNVYQNEIIRQQMIRTRMENERLKRQYQEEERRKKEVQQINYQIQLLATGAANGNATDQYALGNLYFNGQFVQPNPQTAVYWLRREAEQGHALAQSSLGYAYFSGIGISQDYKKAVYWRTKAAEQGETNAQTALGNMYLSGQGIPKNPKKAVYWLKKAAKEGHALAQECLAWAYYEGNGVPKSKIYAYVLFSHVANNSENARNGLQLVENTMTKEQIARAQSVSVYDVLK